MAYDKKYVERKLSNALKGEGYGSVAVVECVQKSKTHFSCITEAVASKDAINRLLEGTIDADDAEAKRALGKPRRIGIHVDVDRDDGSLRLR